MEGSKEGVGLRLRYGKGLERWVAFLVIGTLVALTGCGVFQNGDASGPETDGSSSEEGDGKQNVPEPSKQGQPFQAEEWISRFLENDYGYIYAHATEDFKRQFPRAFLEEMGRSFNEGVKEYRLETHFQTMGGWKYIWSDEKRSRSVTALLDQGMRLTSLQILPLETYGVGEQKMSKNVYDLPFRGSWVVQWGGMDEVVNYHFKSEQERYAFDFVRTEDGFEYAGDGGMNENYYCYGEPITAPADGKVVAVENEIPENQPGYPNNEEPYGNYVILSHANGEYSLLSQLQNNSISVSVGEKVRRGEEIGAVGNSGAAMMPHLHFQVMDSSELDRMKSIPIRFSNKLHLVQGMVAANKG